MTAQIQPERNLKRTTDEEIVLEATTSEHLFNPCLTAQFLTVGLAIFFDPEKTTVSPSILSATMSINEKSVRHLPINR